jgi:hypothetical protein
MGFIASRRRSGRLGVEIWVGGSHTAMESGLQNGCGRPLVSEPLRQADWMLPVPGRFAPDSPQMQADAAHGVDASATAVGVPMY